MTRRKRCRALGGLAGCAIALLLTVFTAQQVQAQGSREEQEILLLEATPAGALPPIALPMPASRNHNYWAFRIQAGDREGPGEARIGAVAAGVDFQYRGGSVIGVTGGYQKRDCGLLGPNCGTHALFGIRSRINLLTGGPTIGSLFHDYSSTTTLGGEAGFGYAPNVISGHDACTLDFGTPITVSVGQRFRVASFLTPGVMWDLNCTGPESPSHPAYLTGVGIGLQQLRSRGLDVYLGFQKIFRTHAGYQIGISVNYVRLP